MKELNSQGPRVLEALPGQRPIAAGEFQALVESGHVVIDLRRQLDFGGGHIPGAFGIPFDPDLSQWAGWVIPYDRPLLLLPAGPEQVDEAVRRLVRVGLDEVRGYLEGGIDAWVRAGLPLSETGQLTPAELRERLQNGEDLEVIDVRTDEEWAAGHVEGARHIMGGWLADRLDELNPDGRRIATICASGFRSTIAASLLQRAGFRDVVNVTGGIDAWRRARLPLAAD